MYCDHNPGYSPQTRDNPGLKQIAPLGQNPKYLTGAMLKVKLL